MIVPDAGGALFCTAGVVVAWATGVPGRRRTGAVVVTALCLLVVHVATALAAAMPVTARGELRLAARWARPTGVLAIATVAAAGLAAGLDRWSPPGSLLIVLAALAVLAVGTGGLTAGSSLGSLSRMRRSGRPRRRPRPPAGVADLVVERQRVDEDDELPVAAAVVERRRLVARGSSRCGR